MTTDSLFQDLRYAFRTLRRDAGFTTFAILIVGLGIGASSTVFSVLNALLLRPLPFQDAARLVWIANHDSAGLSGQTTQVNYLLDLRRDARSFSALAAYFAFYGVGDNKLTGQGEPERLSGVPVSDNFFQVLGVEPQIGRLFNADECKWKGPRAVLLSHGFWERRFASDPAIVGRPLTLSDEPYTVIGAGKQQALGASARDLEGRILSQTLALAAAGMICGTAASWVLSRAFSGLLFGVTAGDPATFFGMLAVLTTVSAIAGYLPARRAARIDPMLALRAN